MVKLLLWSDFQSEKLNFLIWFDNAWNVTDGLKPKTGLKPVGRKCLKNTAVEHLLAWTDFPNFLERFSFLNMSNLAMV